MRVNFIEFDIYIYFFLLKVVVKMLDVKMGEKVYCIVIKNGYELLVFV